MLATSRRKFFALLGATPIAAKAAADHAMADLAGICVSGLGDTSMGLSQGSMGPPMATASNVPYEARLMQAGDYIKLMGVPEWLEYEMRDSARYVCSLDPDLACKKSWSMPVKIAEQRNRNYRRRVDRMHKSAWQHRGRSAMQKLLGFDFPW